jgi:site-specific recombinase XerC
MDYLNDYLGHLAHERALSPLTRENYARDIRRLLQMADGTAISGASAQACMAKASAAKASPACFLHGADSSII